jgi:aminodeoxyfutalosine synthase
MAKEQIVSLIRKAGKTPVERDTLYNELRVY